MTKTSGRHRGFIYWAAHLLLYIPAMFYTLLLCAYVASQMWGWFIVPMGAPRIGVYHAAGLLCAAGLLKLGLARKDFGDDEGMSSAWSTLIFFVVGSLVIWGSGAGWHHLQGTAA